MRIKQAVILAGGRGVRLKPYTDVMPKPLYPVQNIPFIIRLICQIRSFGIRNILILTGYLAEKIVREVGDGHRFDVFVTYDFMPCEFDTGDRLRHAEKFLYNEFLLMYCDNFCPVNLDKLIADSCENHAKIQLSVYSNKDHYTKDNLLVDGYGRITVYDKSRKQAFLSGVDIGYAIVQKSAIDKIPAGHGSFTDVYPVLISEGSLFATVTHHRYYSIGSYERMSLTETFFSGRKAAFLDRDGVLNVCPPKACYVKNPEEFIWIPGAREAVRELNRKGFITILFSNQPGIAKGVMSQKDLDDIEVKMKSGLNETGASMDYCYYCIHGWGEGCDCRKPKPGLLYQAQKDLSLNLTECVVFGDDKRDIEAGRTAGCKTVLVTKDYPLIQAVRDFLKGEKA